MYIKGKTEKVYNVKFLSNYYKTIEVEKEAEKLLPSDQKNNNSELVENQDLSTMEQALDPILAASNKFVGKGLCKY